MPTWLLMLHRGQPNSTYRFKIANKQYANEISL